LFAKGPTSSWDMAGVFRALTACGHMTPRGQFPAPPDQPPADRRVGTYGQHGFGADGYPNALV
jgi:hypothetical protein